MPLVSAIIIALFVLTAISVIFAPDLVSRQHWHGLERFWPAWITIITLATFALLLDLLGESRERQRMGGDHYLAMLYATPDDAELRRDIFETVLIALNKDTPSAREVAGEHSKNDRAAPPLT